MEKTDKQKIEATFYVEERAWKIIQEHFSNGLI
jgi:hypothetical protein